MRCFVIDILYDEQQNWSWQVSHQAALRFLQLRLLDLNDPSTLELHDHLLLFKQDESKDFIEWSGLDNQLQGTLHHLTDRHNLQYEFSLATGVARVSRKFPQQIHQPIRTPNLRPDDPGVNPQDIFNFEQLINVDKEADSIAIKLSTTNLELNTHDYQSLDQRPIEGSNDEIFLDGSSSYSPGNQGSNGDAIWMSEDFFLPSRGDGFNMGDMHQEFKDAEADMQSLLYIDAQRPSTPPSNPIASPTLDQFIASPTEDVTRKRKRKLQDFGLH